MQQANLNGYFNIESVKAPVPTNKLSKSGDSLFRVDAVGKAIADRVFNETSRQYENVWREFDLTFSDLTQKHAAIITSGCDISVFGAIVFSYMVGVGYSNRVGLAIAQIADSNLEASVITAEQIVNGLVASMGEEHRDNLNEIITAEKRKTIIQIKPGQWAVRASSADMQNAQEAEVVISGEV